ncbi:hypothetical protein CONPUDRAFT_87544 [Coniophora puteana RWD-64-598 SS2]|uniref:U4/U6.U5 small nuclear ribonucleoprotein 27kDa protein domain-containing protein n=1 Tax=Coniophora puteana (strain RWD-64-598) TaxID=741705 RepID=A0A5M3N2C7_CONPW|nr:uncharacterized protein CONPUDRAFT_87544 [Coniophora puteana RWD-64-598 SS2]EIW85051.1 hypothetical protein CONPUDRAFT_87544 [Coniophora puteana RWD-64-598 SS2]
MSSRHDDRRHKDRSWERDDRERFRERGGERYSRTSRAGGHRDAGKRRDSRSRSPPRRDRDRRDYGRDRNRDSRDIRDRNYPREDRRGERRDDRRNERLDDRHDSLANDYRHDDKARGSRHGREDEGKPLANKTDLVGEAGDDAGSSGPLTSNEGESMDDINDDDAAMMVAMGMSGFGSTKGKHVEGNQEGGVQLKKTRTWRQYMNRRGGFNRPLDKIK